MIHGIIEIMRTEEGVAKMKALNIPVGISNFEKIRNNGFYYVDKTGLIEELLKTEAEVTLITRPRRFGKTLGMSMLESFFDIRKNSRKLFEGLEIARQSELCSKWMNQCPTVSVSFRQVDGLNFTSAYDMLTMVFADLYNKHLYLLEDSHVTEFQKKTFTNIAHGCGSEKEVKSSLVLLTTMMQQHYGKAVVLLIDEYDVPVAKANAHGYYNEMLDVMKGLLQALKDNQALCFAVVTGCLKIAKESIFTGTNNFVSDTITDSRLNEYFGFVQSEVDQILADAETEDQAENIRKWYDGYHFGDFDVYCPWDVMNYLLELQHNPQAKPVSYWKNTSDNAIIRSFIDHSGSSITKKLENLMAGETIVQRVDENLTYDYLHSSEDNLWSMLYLTGYLTKARNEQTDEVLPDGAIALMIPNEEIRDIFETTVIQWFDDSTRKWNRTLLFDAVWNGDSVNLTKEMNILLRRTISYHDYKEDFYHAFLAGIFTGAGYMVDSNKEHGEGRSDVVVYDPVNGRVAIFEAKYTKNQEKLESTCNTALQQIDERLYAKEYEDDYDQILCYGISFFKKRCLVKIK
ncbi:hypothetical protein ROSEINA2194_01556 [Roseburia inulinivorans DSM 16841]|uniref:AAA-ATPase-like domain-containing protein n=2 Tax=Roseburia inulinivorans TaxID=360807 RepID=C0FS41_9FIRM|nr:hypothetical protein ROSEINA2194_01556 [Roseburia inulinivorans DSM 16841]